MNHCTVPPPGWRCTREAGHDGPCAALPATDDELQLALAEIEAMAEERHLLHSSIGKGDRFWGCSKMPCKRASDFLRGKRKPFCKARANGTAGGNDPQDCDWPWCGCDPLADRVLAAISEQGLKIVKEE